MLKMETNNTEGAIEFCKDLKEVAFKYGGVEYDLTPHLDNIVVLLKEGDKHKKIVDGLEIITTGKDIYANWLRADIRKLKQEHFPKPEGIKINRMEGEMKKLSKAVKEIRNERIARERKYNEKMYDRWFKDLSIQHRADVAKNFWDDASYEEKKREYELE